MLGRCAERAWTSSESEEFQPDVLEGRIEPGRVLDRAVGLDRVPDGFRAMNDRESIKVMVEP